MLHGYGGRRRRKPKATESAEGRNKLPGVVDQQVNVTAGGEHAARRRKIEDEVPSILEPKLRGSRPEAPCLSKTRDRPIGKGEIPVAVGPGRGRITRPADGTAATRADVRQRLRRLPRRPADTTDEHRRRRHGPEEIQEPTRRWARAPERRPATDREIGGGGVQSAVARVRAAARRVLAKPPRPARSTDALSIRVDSTTGRRRAPDLRGGSFAACAAAPARRRGCSAPPDDRVGPLADKAAFTGRPSKTVMCYR